MIYILTLLEGIASFISPCILPLLPIYISYFAGSKQEKRKAIVNATAFVIGFSIVFILIAMISNIVGNAIAKYIGIAKIVFGIVIIILGLNYMEILKINIFNRFRKSKADVKNLNFVKSVVFGVLFSVSITPCIGTFLSSALLLIASKENIIEGLTLIILYCIGLGVPFIVSAMLIEKLKTVFEFIKKHFKQVKIASGLVLIIMGIYLIFV